jgi:CubicO group peptidase (beta-lactamase class C family)
MQRRTVLALAAGLPALASTNATAQRGRSSIDDYIRERMRAKEIPGAATAIVRSGREVRVAAFGKASLEFGIDADENTLFPMASSSKILAGLSAGLLVQLGKIDLDSPIRQYLEELPSHFDAVRVSQLLSHTSGLGGLDRNPGFQTERDLRKRRSQFADQRKLEFFTPDELIAYGAEVPFVEPPGSLWRYNQFPYFLFGQIVWRVTGRDYDAFVEQSIFKPLGMTNTRFGDHRAVIPHRASTNYTRQYGPLQNFALEYSPLFWPAAGCNTSAADFTRLFAALEPNRLLSADILERLWRPAPLNDGGVANYGLGFDLAASGGRRRVGHEGGGCCYMCWYPEQRLGVAILMNLSGSGEDGIDSTLADRLLRD